MMKKIFWVLCLSLYPAVAVAATNFETCVAESKGNRSNTTVDNYSAYKCDGSTAANLARQPDACMEGQTPSERNMVHESRPISGGLFLSVTWSVGKCWGMCETQQFDSKDRTDICTLHVYNNGNAPALSRRAETRPIADARPAVTRPTENRTTENHPEEGQPAGSRPAQNSGGQPHPAAAPRETPGEARHRRPPPMRSAWSPRLRGYSHNIGGYPPGPRFSYAPPPGPPPPPPPPGFPDFWESYQGCSCP
jgi:hypothetical protein